MSCLKGILYFLLKKVMFNFLINILETNIDYKTVLTGIFVYLLLLWLMFCFWVFMDSQKRYNNFIVSIVFFLLVLVFNFPALIFYLIIRPEKEEDNIMFLQGGDMGQGGVNVPIVNFLGKDGIELSLQLKISNKSTVMNPNLKVNVDWESSDSNFELKGMSNDEVKYEDAPSTKKEAKPKKQPGKNFASSLKNKGSMALGKMKNMSQNLFKDVKSYGNKLDEHETETVKEEKKSEDKKVEKPVE